MKTILTTTLSILCIATASAQRLYYTPLAENAVRVRYAHDSLPSMTDWIYVNNDYNGEAKVNITERHPDVLPDHEVAFVSHNPLIGCTDITPSEVAVIEHVLRNDTAKMRFSRLKDGYFFGLGQFQDGYTNVAKLPRRLTQVNTQISMPVLISNYGYGIVWNNYAKTDYNLPDNKVELKKTAAEGAAETVNVTTTEGGRQETRHRHIFEAEIDIPEDGEYAVLLDVGQKMARRHNLDIDGKNVIEMQNLWLPPTASKIVNLTKGRHKLTAELTENDRPVVYYSKVKEEISFTSYPSDAVDYTVIFGNTDEIIATYRKLTGESPLMPAWALGYIHCRERFHSQKEIIETADRFEKENIPVDVIVQDWQYWGKNGWNSMVFDADDYPDPKALTNYLHSKNIKMMLSVWSKIDKNSALGKEMLRNNYYIPNTDWIDFFKPEAAAAYWKNFSQKLLPLGIDAWWQDATEPENDDLENRMVNDGKIDGNRVRNVYPLMVNKTVYEGLTNDQPNKRPMILTRSGFLGIQRYGSALWSGDVGNDWETLRRQIAGGLGLQAAGVPWWTYDAGGFFRPWDQYQNQDYINRMLRWIEISVYLPLMRVHGYMSDTEPWKYGADAQATITRCIRERKSLFPYIYSNAAEVAFNGSTLMRPLVFDFNHDTTALAQKYEYMFGKALLISPVTEPDVTEWETYLPENKAGWYDRRNPGKHYDGGQTVKTKVDANYIPVFAKGGSIVVENGPDNTLQILIYSGDNCEFTLYEDDGETTDYQNGKYAKTLIRWDMKKKKRTLTIEPAGGNLTKNHHIVVKIFCHEVWADFTLTSELDYNGKQIQISY